MVDKKRPGKTIRLRLDTVARIDKMKPRGQTYDGFISTVLDSYEQERHKPTDTGNRELPKR